MARINKGSLTRLEIVSEASSQFLEKGYSKTTVSSIAKALEMSSGNLTFHYPTKEHLLAELVDTLCIFSRKQMEQEANDGISSILAICLELTAMAAACEDDPITRDFLLSAYSSPICLDVIRRNDMRRAMKVFAPFCPDWTEEQFAVAESLVSGVEYATLMTTGDPIPLETRISAAIRIILGIFGVPEEMQTEKLKKVFAMNYRSIGQKAIVDFRDFVARKNEDAFRKLMQR